MNYLRKSKNRFISKVELVSALDEGSFLINPPSGFTDESIQVEYNQTYFTITSITFSQKSKGSNAGPFWTVELDFSFPYFKECEKFIERFKLISEIRLILNTGEITRINKNDISLNKAMEANIQTNVRTINYSVSITQMLPFKIW
ncbi:MAG: hypothetical protein WCJ72_03310 [Chryseobacterium sp.]